MNEKKIKLKRYNELSEKDARSELTADEEIELLQLDDELESNQYIVDNYKDYCNLNGMQLELNQYGFIERKTQSSWKSNLNFVSNLILIPEDLELICKSIQSQVGSDEFSILTRGNWTKNGFQLEKEFIIPKQEVGSCNVDFEEDIGKFKKEGFNTIIHSHPFTNDATFSGSDDETINKNFMCSVLFCRGGFTDATLKIEVKKHLKLGLTPDIKVVSSTKYPEVDISNIKQNKIKNGTYKYIDRNKGNKNIKGK